MGGGKGRVCDFPVKWLRGWVSDDGRRNRTEAFLPSRPSHWEGKGLAEEGDEGECSSTYRWKARGRGESERRGTTSRAPSATTLGFVFDGSRRIIIRSQRRLFKAKWLRHDIVPTHKISLYFTKGHLTFNNILKIRYILIFIFCKAKWLHDA